MRAEDLDPSSDLPSRDPLVQAEPRALSDGQQRLLEAAWGQIEQDALRELVSGFVSTPSPTGEERPLAEHIVQALEASGVDATTQVLDDRQANAVGVRRGSGQRPSLLLYAPIDTLTTGRLEDDAAGIGPALRADMLPHAFTEHEHVLGLGAGNPKGHATAVVAAIKAVADAGIPLEGDLLVGLGAGGMPTNAGPAPGGRRHIGQGVGCSFMLEQGVRADYAIVAKPGPSVEWEEVGLCWFRVDVIGTHGYVGSRHRMEHRNAIAEAAHVVTELERWFRAYTEQHASGLVAPQGSVGAIEGGWPHKPSFTPYACRIHMDLRISPRTDPMEARRAFADALAAIEKARPGLRLDWDMTLSIPGTRTDPRSEVVQSCLRGWETVMGERHTSVSGTSGATDANILRGRGLPTARVGMPKPVGAPVSIPEDFAMGMNVVSLAALERLTRVLVYAAVDVCTSVNS